jgi:hypothetical protein
LLAILGKAYLAMSRELPTREERMLALSTWEEIVTPIPTSRLNDCYVRAMQDHEGFAMLGAHELVAAWRAIQAAGTVARVDPDPLVGPRMAPDELAAEIRRLREQVWPEAKTEVRGSGWQRVAEVRPALEGEVVPPIVVCGDCSLEYRERPAGCPRCVIKRRVAAAVANEPLSLDDAAALDLAPVMPAIDGDDEEIPF